MIKSIIFDMDGVISDTQKIHSKIEAKLLNRFGVNITASEITEKYSGVHTNDFFQKLLGKRIDVDALLEEKWMIMAKEISENGVSEIDGASQLIEKLHKKYSLAVASASPLHFIETVLSSLQLRDYFSCIASAEEVENGKPEPDVFLLAAERLNISPQNCLVIEDGISGIVASKKAGMYCIGIVHNQKLDYDKYPANKLVNKMEQIKII